MAKNRPGPQHTRVCWVKGKNKTDIAKWFEGLGFRVTIWSADKDDNGVWDILYVPDDRVASVPPVDVDLDTL